MPPFETQTALRILEDNLGASPDQVFAEFDELPIAAASLGQVGQAQLSSAQSDSSRHMVTAEHHSCISMADSLVENRAGSAGGAMAETGCWGRTGMALYGTATQQRLQVLLQLPLQSCSRVQHVLLSLEHQLAAPGQQVGAAWGWLLLPAAAAADDLGCCWGCAMLWRPGAPCHTQDW